MTAMQPFMPKYGSNQVLTAGAASASATLDRGNKQVRVVNTGANKAYFRTYNATDGAQSATIADCVVIPGETVIVTKNGSGVDGHNSLAYISAAGTTLEVMTGEGFD